MVQSARPLADRLPRLLRFAVGFGCMLLTIAHAQPFPERAVASDLIERRWMTEDGLPHGIVSRIVQDGRGFLWLATAGGLARFDGRNFRVFPIPQSLVGMSFNIRDLALENPDTLLLLPASGGVMRFQNGVFTEHPVTSAVRNLSLVDLFVEADGTVWLGTEDDKVLRWHDGELREFGAESGINRRGNRFTFAKDRDNRVWVAGGDFLGWFADDRLQPAAKPLGSSYSVASSRGGGVWVSTFESLWKIDGGQVFEALAAPDWPIARSSVYHLFEDSRGTLWISTRRHGLFRVRGTEVTAVHTSSPQITAVMEENDGNIWVSIQGGGIARFRPKSFVLLNHVAGLPEDISSSVCTDEFGATWCANRSGGLVRWLDGTSSVMTNTDRVEGLFPISAYPDGKGHVWFGTDAGLYRISTRAPFAVEKVRDDLGAVRVLYISKANTVWVGSGDGALGWFENGSYHAVVPNQQSSDRRVTAIDENKAGEIWASTRDGELYAWNQGVLHQFPFRAPDSPPQRINGLRFDRYDELWLATPRGLFRRRGDVLQRYARADGLPEDNLDQLIFDDRERLWLSGRSGLFFVNLDQLRAHRSPEDEPLRATTFGRDDGLSGTSSFMGGQPLNWRSADGRLWFATHLGIVGLASSPSAPNRNPPPIYFDEIKIDDRPVAIATEIVTGVGPHRLDFSFVALNYSAPEKLRIRHQLVGMDLDWIETVSEHTATYPRLPPGRYVMRVRAGNQDNVWSSEAASVQIVVPAAWWQTVGFKLAAMSGFTALIVVVVRRWSHRRLVQRLQHLEYERGLETERTRIARDLHDELGGGLTQIKLLAERIKRQSSAPGNESALGQLAWKASRLTADLQSIVWAVNPSNNTWDRMAAFMNQYIQRFFREAGVQCHTSGFETVPATSLAPEVQHHLLAIIKEVLNNIAKHAAASKVTVSVQTDDRQFSLIVHDNGNGFDPSACDRASTNGLRNIQTRTAEIEGSVEIKSSPGDGTTLRLVVPIATLSADAQG